ncbi:MAG TPA: hypothetical protein VNL95_09725 [Dehalococcoidia bacterium]|jgi:ketosteroid isomerase-like protein|nr:hypothetical protein [Dehalococcoidia bacterium]
MSQQEVEQAVHRFSKAVVTMDIGQLMNDLTPEAMVKLQAAAGAGMAVQIQGYEVQSVGQEGEDWVSQVKYLGPTSFTARLVWRKFGNEWKIADADVLATESGG